jgi:hypothetical protein
MTEHGYPLSQQHLPIRPEKYTRMRRNNFKRHKTFHAIVNKRKRYSSKTVNVKHNDRPRGESGQKRLQTKMGDATAMRCLRCSNYEMRRIPSASTFYAQETT